MAASSKPEIIKFHCAQCGQKLSVPVGLEGQKFSCPNCAVRSHVPGSSPRELDAKGPTLIKFFCMHCGQKLSCEAGLARKANCPVCLEMTPLPQEKASRLIPSPRVSPEAEASKSGKPVAPPARPTPTGMEKEKVLEDDDPPPVLQQSASGDKAQNGVARPAARKVPTEHLETGKGQPNGHSNGQSNGHSNGQSNGQSGHGAPLHKATEGHPARPARSGAEQGRESGKASWWKNFFGGGASSSDAVVGKSRLPTDPGFCEDRVDPWQKKAGPAGQPGNGRFQPEKRPGEGGGPAGSSSGAKQPVPGSTSMEELFESLQKLGFEVESFPNTPGNGSRGQNGRPADPIDQTEQSGQTIFPEHLPPETSPAFHKHHRGQR